MERKLYQPNPSDQDHLLCLKELKIENFKNKNVLDLGCGSGYLCQKVFLEGGNKIYGVDLKEPKFFEDDTKWIYLNLDLDQKNWSFDLKEKFDLVFAFDILEHLSSPYYFLKNCKEKMKENSFLIITTPNIFSWERWKNPIAWSGANDPEHKTLFSRYSLEFLLNKTGFKVESISSPIRSLKKWNVKHPQVGGQIICKASLK